MRRALASQTWDWISALCSENLLSYLTVLCFDFLSCQRVMIVWSVQSCVTLILLPERTCCPAAWGVVSRQLPLGSALSSEPKSHCSWGSPLPVKEQGSATRACPFLPTVRLPEWIIFALKLLVGLVDIMVWWLPRPNHTYSLFLSQVFLPYKAEHS